MPAVRGRSESIGKEVQQSSKTQKLFLIHQEGDHVGVVTTPISAGDTVTGVYMDTNEKTEITSKSDIPLGHKIALVNLEDNADVVEYGVKIGITTKEWVKGDYVHTHNIKTARW